MFRGVSALDRTPVAAPVLSAAGVFHCRRRRVEAQGTRVESRYFGIVSGRSLRASTRAS